MSLKFSYELEDKVLCGTQLYRKSEYSFDFIPESKIELEKLTGKHGTTSISIGTLQIEIGIEKRNLLYVWGYHPWFNWEEVALPNWSFNKGKVSLTSDQILQAGVSLSLDQDKAWKTLRSKSFDRIIITSSEQLGNGQLVKVSDNLGIELLDDQITSFFIDTKFV